MPGPNAGGGRRNRGRGGGGGGGDGPTRARFSDWTPHGKKGKDKGRGGRRGGGRGGRAGGRGGRAGRGVDDAGGGRQRPPSSSVLKGVQAASLERNALHAAGRGGKAGAGGRLAVIHAGCDGAIGSGGSGIPASNEVLSGLLAKKAKAVEAVDRVLMDESCQMEVFRLLREFDRRKMERAAAEVEVEDEAETEVEAEAEDSEDEVVDGVDRAANSGAEGAEHGSLTIGRGESDDASDIRQQQVQQEAEEEAARASHLDRMRKHLTEALHFRPRDVENAIAGAAPSIRFEDVLDWLCMHLREAELDRAFGRKRAMAPQPVVTMSALPAATTASSSTTAKGSAAPVVAKADPSPLAVVSSSTDEWGKHWQQLRFVRLGLEPRVVRAALDLNHLSLQGRPPTSDDMLVLLPALHLMYRRRQQTAGAANPEKEEEKEEGVEAALEDIAQDPLLTRLTMTHQQHVRQYCQDIDHDSIRDGMAAATGATSGLTAADVSEALAEELAVIVDIFDDTMRLCRYRFQGDGDAHSGWSDSLASTVLALHVDLTLEIAEEFLLVKEEQEQNVHADAARGDKSGDDVADGSSKAGKATFSLIFADPLQFPNELSDGGLPAYPFVHHPDLPAHLSRGIMDALVEQVREHVGGTMLYELANFLSDEVNNVCTEAEKKHQEQLRLQREAENRERERQQQAALEQQQREQEQRDLANQRAADGRLTRGAKKSIAQFNRISNQADLGTQGRSRDVSTAGNASVASGGEPGTVSGRSQHQAHVDRTMARLLEAQEEEEDAEVERAIRVKYLVYLNQNVGNDEAQRRAEVDVLGEEGAQERQRKREQEEREEAEEEDDADEDDNDHDDGERGNGAAGVPKKAANDNSKKKAKKRKMTAADWEAVWQQFVEKTDRAAEEVERQLPLDFMSHNLVIQSEECANAVRVVKDRYLARFVDKKRSQVVQHSTQQQIVQKLYRASTKLAFTIVQKANEARSQGFKDTPGVAGAADGDDEDDHVLADVKQLSARAPPMDIAEVAQEVQQLSKKQPWLVSASVDNAQTANRDDAGTDADADADGHRITTRRGEEKREAEDDADGKPRVGAAVAASPATIVVERTAEQQAEYDHISRMIKRDWDRTCATRGYRRLLEQRQRLPAYRERERIVDLIEQNQVTVISGETGSGKTTQIAQLVYDAYIARGDAAACNMIVTQPRRISAVSVAQRMAEERCEQVGRTVGYSIRLETRRSASTRILLCTTGVLLRRLQCDGNLDTVSHIFLDEVHERNVQSDFLLIILRDLLERRPTLRIICMSATLNAELFSNFFSGCPVAAIPGRAFPVTAHYLEDVLQMTQFEAEPNAEYARRDVQPGRDNMLHERMQEMGTRYRRYDEGVHHGLAVIDESKINYDLIVALLEYLCLETGESGGAAGARAGTTAPATSGGSEQAILVFLPGFAEIQNLLDACMENEVLGDSRRVRLIPLHSSLSTDEQTRVFELPPPGVRKIVLSTNIAETSITIEDVVFVVDTCRVKENGYDAENAHSTLEEVFVSKASARQRRGRAGRVRSGMAYHLVPSHSFEALADYQQPEMLRVALDDVILQILLLDLGTPHGFLGRALNPPSWERTTHFLDTLKDLQAIAVVGKVEPAAPEPSRLRRQPHQPHQQQKAELDARLTPLGYHLSTLPVAPRLGKMLLYGAMLGCVEPVLTIAAALSVRNPFVTPFEKRDQADAAKQEFSVAHSDVLTILKAYDAWAIAAEHGQRHAWRFTRDNFLSQNGLQMMRDMREQFRDLLLHAGFVTQGSKLGRRGGAGGKKGRGGYAAPGQAAVAIDASDNRLHIIKATLVAGLYPNVCMCAAPSNADRPKRTHTLAPSLAGKTAGELTFRGKRQKEIYLHPASVNFQSRELDTRFIVYHEMVRTSKIYLRDSTTVTPYSILLFGGDLSVRHNDETVSVDGWVHLRASPKVATLAKHLRHRMDALFLRKITNPQEDVSDLAEPLIMAIDLLLAQEDVHTKRVDYRAQVVTAAGRAPLSAHSAPSPPLPPPSHDGLPEEGESEEEEKVQFGAGGDVRVLRRAVHSAPPAPPQPRGAPHGTDREGGRGGGGRGGGGRGRHRGGRGRHGQSGRGLAGSGRGAAAGGSGGGDGGGGSRGRGRPSRGGRNRDRDRG